MFKVCWQYPKDEGVNEMMGFQMALEARKGDWVLLGAIQGITYIKSLNEKFLTKFLHFSEQFYITLTDFWIIVLLTICFSHKI